MFKGWFRWKEVLLGYLVFVWMFLFMVAGGFIFSGSASAQQSTPLTVLQPNGGESWKAGNRYDLKWQSPTNAYKFNLVYSTDNKTTWSNITEVLASNACNNTGSYLDCKISWRIPPQNGNKPYSFVKVIAKDINNQLIGQDVSDNAFAIEVLRVTSPNGNETLRVGQTYPITWETYALSKPVLMVILQYSTDGGSSWKPIKTFLWINPKRYSWRVPNDPSPNCKVRVVLRDFSGKVVAVDESDRPFTIIGSGSNPSFAISLNPDSLMVSQGGSNTTTLIVTPQNGFTGTINLSLVAGQDRVPEGITLSPQSVQVTGSSRVSQILTLNASANTPTGTYRLKVRGTGQNITRDVDLTVTVSAPSGGGGGSDTGSVNTPGGQVQLVLQGGTFTQGPTSQNVSPPQGFQAPYGAIAFTAQVPRGGTLTVTLTFPNPIPQGAVLKKYLNNTWQDVPGAQLSGSSATYQVRDGGALDADGQANGQVVDPVALLVSNTSTAFSTWMKTYGTPQRDSVRGAIQVADGGYLIYGTWADIGSKPMPIRGFLAKLSSAGHLEWSKLMGQGIFIDQVVPTLDGGYFMVGEISIGSLNYLLHISKVDAQGNPAWSKVYREPNLFPNVLGVFPTQDGGYTVFGAKSFQLANASWKEGTWIMRLDSQGNILWQKGIANEGSSRQSIRGNCGNGRRVFPRGLWLIQKTFWCFSSLLSTRQVEPGRRHYLGEKDQRLVGE